MRMPHMIGMLSVMGQAVAQEKNTQDRRYLEDNGWVCLGAEVTSGVVHWTNTERGLADGGPVTFYRALCLQRTKDAIAQRKD